MNPNHYAVIMAGGVGSRFWPLSRTAHPKQFLDILGRGESLLQHTYSRFLDIIPQENIYVITHQQYIDQTQAQLPDLKPEQIIGEPSARNTAACIAYGTMRLLATNPEAQMVISPADHLVRRIDKFHEDIQLALKVTAEKPFLMTLGITPTRPDTGYGYIQFRENKHPESYYKVITFTEKPNLELAQQFLLSGDFVWNSGIFIFSADTMRHALKKHLSDTYDLFFGGRSMLGTPQERSFIESIYPQIKPISIDFGVMEKADNVYVIKSDFGWSDLGTWTSLYDEMDKDFLENAIQGNVIVYNAISNVINTPPEKLVVVKGIDNLIVVDTGDVLLICPKDQEQSIREIVSDLKKDRRNNYI